MHTERAFNHASGGEGDGRAVAKRRASTRRVPAECVVRKTRRIEDKHQGQEDEHSNPCLVPVRLANADGDMSRETAQRRRRDGEPPVRVEQQREEVLAGRETASASFRPWKCTAGRTIGMIERVVCVRRHPSLISSSVPRTRLSDRRPVLWARMRGRARLSRRCMLWSCSKIVCSQCLAPEAALSMKLQIRMPYTY